MIVNPNKTQWFHCDIPVETRTKETEKAYLFETGIGRFWMPKKLVRASKKAGYLDLAFPDTFTINLQVGEAFSKEVRQMSVGNFVNAINDLFDPNKGKTQEEVTKEVFKDSDEIPF